MSGRHALKDLTKNFPPQRRARVEAKKGSVAEKGEMTR